MEKEVLAGDSNRPGALLPPWPVSACHGRYLPWQLRYLPWQLSMATMCLVHAAWPKVALAPWAWERGWVERKWTELETVSQTQLDKRVWWAIYWYRRERESYTKRKGGKRKGEKKERVGEGPEFCYEN